MKAGRILPIIMAVCAVGSAGCAPRLSITPPSGLESTLAHAVHDGPGADAVDVGLAAPVDVDEAWWTAYGDPQLDRLVESAFARNVDLARSALSIRRAVLQARLLGVDLRPAFSGGGDGSWRRSMKDGGPTAQSYGMDVGVSYELDLWRRLRDVRDAQVWEARATVEDEAATRLALANTVVDAYYHWAYLLDATTAILESMEHYADIESKTRAKADEGKVPAAEPVQARQSWLSAKASLIDLQTQRKTVEQTLRNVLNLRPGDPLDVVPPSLTDFPVGHVDLDVPLTVLSNRPDLRALSHRLCGAFRGAEATRKSWYPTVTLGGSLSSSGSRAHRMFDAPFMGGAVQVDFPFLRGDRVRLNLLISESEYESARLAFEQGVTTALNEVDTYRFMYEKSVETWENSREKWLGDQVVAEHYRHRYEQGANELADWLSALNTLTSSRLSVVQSRYQVMRAENLLHQSMAGRYGGGGMVAVEMAEGGGGGGGGGGWAVVKPPR